MKLDFCIPAYNEEKIIEESIREVLTALRAIPGIEYRLVVLDNASTDETASRARAVGGVDVISIPVRGKGAAVCAAARMSTADFFGFIDADLSADPRDIGLLISALISNETDIVVGSRFLNTGIVQRGFFRTLSSVAFNLIRRLFLGIKVSDTQCGLKMMNAKGLKALALCRETGWFFDVEFLARAERMGLSIREVPIHWKENHFPDRKSKLGFFDALETFLAMGRIQLRLMLEKKVETEKR